MTFVKGKSGNPAGKIKGTPNKFTDLKQMFLNVAERLGGEDRLLEYAKEDPKSFYQMLHVMLPRNVQEEIRKDIRITWGPAPQIEQPDIQAIDVTPKKIDK